MRTQITDLIGLRVYTESGVYVGEVEDIVLDIDAKRIDGLAIGSLNKDLIDVKKHKGIRIPYRLVKSVSDVVVLRNIPAMFKGSQME
ncbi:MAG: PRC-barrel domain-containing protein [Methanospirillaceae archaeon]|nr:PRC-barrel domain-containing protein [Methanospirillaceae archaeon]